MFGLVLVGGLMWFCGLVLVGGLVWFCGLAWVGCVCVVGFLLVGALVRFEGSLGWLGS